MNVPKYAFSVVGSSQRLAELTMGQIATSMMSILLGPMLSEVAESSVPGKELAVTMSNAYSEADRQMMHVLTEISKLEVGELWSSETIRATPTITVVRLKDDDSV